MLKSNVSQNIQFVVQSIAAASYPQSTAGNAMPFRQESRDLNSMSIPTSLKIEEVALETGRVRRRSFPDFFKIHSTSIRKLNKAIIFMDEIADILSRYCKTARITKG
jgi:hypothetical protein